jgi:hypothetical protein
MSRFLVGQPFASARRLTGKQGKLHEHQRQAGEAHPLGVTVEPGERRFAEFKYQLVLAKLQFHDALLVGVLPNFLQPLCHLHKRQDIKETFMKTTYCDFMLGIEAENVSPD